MYFQCARILERNPCCCDHQYRGWRTAANARTLHLSTPEQAARMMLNASSACYVTVLAITSLLRRSSLHFEKYVSSSQRELIQTCHTIIQSHTFSMRAPYHLSASLCPSLEMFTQNQLVETDQLLLLIGEQHCLFTRTAL